MASQVTNYKCPSCGGALHFGHGSQMLECDFCGNKFDLKEFDEAMKQENDQAAEEFEKDQNSQWDTSKLTDDWGNAASSMKSYTCPACGAELVCDATTAATCCPYCGNQTIVPGNFAGTLKPEYVIPFKTDKKQAIEALKKHYEGKKLLPDSFASTNHIEEIQGVYVPFWMYDCLTYGDTYYSATRTHVHRDSEKEVTETEHFRLERSGQLPFEKVPVDASTKMPDSHMESIEPYDYRELKEFSMSYMPGFLANRYDESAEDCGQRMANRCAEAFLNEMNRTVFGYDSVGLTNKRIAVKKGNVHYAMLPVWLLATKWNGQNFLFAMNGQTGKLVGDLPTDKGKWWKYFFIFFAVFAVIACGFAFMMVDNPMEDYPVFIG
ncbi:MAG: hypothetical protein HUJ58_03445, partial [Erysipelotrichaceae bacterium]|nr:hypothetical protein [Erysipelotrichaceae bacterium]